MKDPIIILGPGRCGSTLLQRILNTSENITIWGEHAGFLSKLAESYELLAKSEAMENNFYSKTMDPSILIGSLKDYTVCPNWLNSFDRQSIIDDYRSFIANLLNKKLDIQKNYWGFKEIRYTKDDPALDMLLELFPSSLLIFSIRNPFHVIKSMVLDWSNPSRLKNQIENKKFKPIEKSIINYAERWKNVVASFQYWLEEKQYNCYVEKYEELLKNPEKQIENLFNFLKLPMPENALKPMSIKMGSKKLPLSSTVGEIIDSMRKDIWLIVGDSAEYFGYTIDSISSEKESDLVKIK